MRTRSRLGRGLAALIGEVDGESSSVERPRGQRRVPTGSLRPNARNPRRTFSNAELDDLVASLRERGIIQPIVARPVRGAADSFEIIAGERRWRAAQRAGLHEVPVVIIEATDAEALAARHHRERAARRSQCARRGRRLPRADGRVRQQPGRDRKNHRQEPQPRRQYATAPKTAGDGQGLYTRRQALCRTRPHAGRPARRRKSCRRNRRPRSQRSPGRSDGARSRRQERKGRRQWP